MAHSYRSTAKDRRKKNVLNATVESLEVREVLTPVISTQTYATTFTASGSGGTVAVTGTAFDQSAAGFTSITQLANSAQFGGDIVRIQAGPGGDFGAGVYAISRGAGSNTGAVNTPGVIYRVDTATGKASVFFDLNNMIQQLEKDPLANASTLVSNSSGLKNWYDISFDPEGYFFGRSAMLVSMADATDATKNAVYAIGSDGSLIGILAQFSDASTGKTFTVTPTATLVPGLEYQSKVRGLFTGNGTQNTTTGNWTALFFDANTYRPGQALNQTILPPGVFHTNLTLGPQTGLTDSNAMYQNAIYSSFTNLEGGGAGGLPGATGLSGVQWTTGTATGLMIGNQSGAQPYPTSLVTTAALPAGLTTAVDTYGVSQASFRRLSDIAFDKFGSFSYGSTFTAGTSTSSATAGTPTYVGSLFVADMSPGLAATGAVTVGGTATNFYVPVSGPGSINVTGASYTFSPSGTQLGGRVMRIAPDGTMTPFAENFNVSTAIDFNAFLNSALSVTFSTDGTKMWVADNDGIWQFASTLSLAGSTTGSIIGLTDIRTLGMPYQGQNSAVAVLDTGVDASNTSFQGRVARGTNINRRNGVGNIDTAGIASSSSTTAGSTTAGHGTPVAGVVNQMVPQATILPINLFVDGAVPGSVTGLGYTSNQAIFNALKYLSQHPFVNDPVRPGQKDRVIASTMAWGTANTFPTEGQAYAAYPQVVASFKQQLAKIRKLGITSIASAGQFGTPKGSTTTSGSTTTASTGDFDGMSMPAVLNEVVSVSGSSAMPFYLTPNTDPMDPNIGPYPRANIPAQLRGTSSSGSTTSIGTGQVATMTAGYGSIYADDILYASNTSITTDYVAPAIDVPTYAQTSTARGNDPLVFDAAGTSMSAGVATGSFAIVSSAINYWVSLAKTGATSDAYLTQPVGARTLNYGKNTLKDLSFYANPDGVNSILQWTAVPVNYSLMNDFGASTSGSTTTGTVIQPQTDLSYSRIDVGNAIAAIESEVAMQWLLKNGTFTVIDSNKNGMITASELQYFVDNSTAMGMPEAGSMARLLGGTATYTVGATAAQDVPDPAGALARRFNFLDYAADGQINGYITLDQIKQEAQTLLPKPDAFTIIDRTRASANSYLLDPTALRNYNTITTLNYNWVYATRTQWQSTLKKFQGFSPAQYGVNKGQNDRSNPSYVLFDGPMPKSTAKAASKSSSSSSNTVSSSYTGGSTAAANQSGSTTGSSSSSTSTSNSSSTGSSSNSAANTQAALLAALKNLAAGMGNPTPTGTSTTVKSSTATVSGATSGGSTGTVTGASNLGRKLPAVVAQQSQSQTNVIYQAAKPAKSKNVVQSFINKLGIGKIV